MYKHDDEKQIYILLQVLQCKAAERFQDKLQFYNQTDEEEATFDALSRASISVIDEENINSNWKSDWPRIDEITKDQSTQFKMCKLGPIKRKDQENTYSYRVLQVNLKFYSTLLLNLYILEF